jgi:hypothetical protein
MPTTELSLQELQEQSTTLLPQRETLAFINVAKVHAINAATAFNVHSYKSFAAASATQTIVVIQG